MNKVLDVKVVAMNAMIATVYAVLTIVCASISYGAINLRISEIIVFLAFFNRKYIPGLIVGCFLANQWEFMMLFLEQLLLFLFVLQCIV